MAAQSCKIAIFGSHLRPMCRVSRISCRLSGPAVTRTRKARSGTAACPKRCRAARVCGVFVVFPCKKAPLLFVCLAVIHSAKVGGHVFNERPSQRTGEGTAFVTLRFLTAVCHIPPPATYLRTTSPCRFPPLPFARSLSSQCLSPLPCLTVCLGRPAAWVPLPLQPLPLSTRDRCTHRACTAYCRGSPPRRS